MLSVYIQIYCKNPTSFIIMLFVNVSLLCSFAFWHVSFCFLFAVFINICLLLPIYALHNRVDSMKVYIVVFSVIIGLSLSSYDIPFYLSTAFIFVIFDYNNTLLSTSLSLSLSLSSRANYLHCNPLKTPSHALSVSIYL